MKANRKAREMLIKPGEEFSVEKIIELALAQNIKIDKSVGGVKVEKKFDD